MSLGVPFLGVDEMGELGRIPDKKHGGVIEDPIPVSFVGPELDGKSTGVASSVGGAWFATNSRETNSSANFFADGAE
jgi:hypothetical protein